MSKIDGTKESVFIQDRKANVFEVNAHSEH